MLDLFQIVLGAAIFLSTLAMGLVLVFAIVVMPGIGTLNDHQFLRSFQVIDRVIQQNQPIFITVWLGAAISVIVAAIMGLTRLDGIALGLLLTAAVIYIVGVQLPTFIVNIPLNNRIQTLEIDDLDAKSARSERERFEARWNRWNGIRTILGSLSSLLLIYLLATL